MMVGLVLAVMLVLSRASEPSMVLAEQGRTRAAEATVAALQAQIALYPPPTARPCHTAPYYGSC